MHFFVWKMNIKLWLKFATHTSWLQLALDVFNFNVLFKMKGITCLGVFLAIKLHFTSIIFFIGFDID